MGVDVKTEKCPECSGFGYCSLCLNSGLILSGQNWIECTRCNWETPGVCSWCKGKGIIEHISRTEDDDSINLNFSNDSKEDFEIDI